MGISYSPDIGRAASEKSDNGSQKLQGNNDQNLRAVRGWQLVASVGFNGTLTMIMKPFITIEKAKKLKKPCPMMIVITKVKKPCAPLCASSWRAPPASRTPQTCRASPARPGSRASPAARPAYRTRLFCFVVAFVFESRLQPRTPTNPKWFLHRSTSILTYWTFVPHAYESQVVPASLDLLTTGLAAFSSFSGMLLLHHGAFGETLIA